MSDERNERIREIGERLLDNLEQTERLHSQRSADLLARKQAFECAVLVVIVAVVFAIAVLTL